MQQLPSQTTLVKKFQKSEISPPGPEMNIQENVQQLPSNKMLVVAQHDKIESENVCTKKIDKTEHSQSCSTSWDRLLKLWGETDRLIVDMIAETKGGPQRKDLKAGNPQECTKRLEHELELLKQAGCDSNDCQDDRETLLNLCEKNIRSTRLSSHQEETNNTPEYKGMEKEKELDQNQKSTPQNSSQSQEDDCQDERDDPGFREWRAWQVRDKTRRKTEERSCTKTQLMGPLKVMYQTNC